MIFKKNRKLKIGGGQKIIKNINKNRKQNDENEQ